MQKLNTPLVVLFLITSTLCFGDSKIKEFLEKNEVNQISQLIKSASSITDEADLPDNPKTNELVIVENEYDVKILFEFFDEQWNEISDAKIAEILQGDTKSTFHHMFNYKVDAKEFNPYVSDEFKEETPSTNIQSLKVKLLRVDFDEKSINKSISEYTTENEILANDIINIQILNTKNDSVCNIVISYKSYHKDI